MLKRSPDPESLALEHTVPYHAVENSSIANTSHYIIYQTGKGEPRLKYNMLHVKSLPIDWLIVSIVNFKLVPPEQTQNYLKVLI